MMVAQVTLVGAVAAPVWNAPPDLLTTTTDDRGWFRVMARECVEYSAWAISGGMVSELAGGVVPGPQTELVVKHEQRSPIAVVGLDAWRDRGPFVARLWLDGGSGHRADVPLVADLLELPAGWPRTDFTFELLGRDANSITVARFGQAMGQIPVPEPREVDVLVEDPQGRPVTGAEIWVESSVGSRLPEIGGTERSFVFVVGRTGDDGRCKARIGTEWVGKEARRGLLLRAGKPGYAEACGGWDHALRCMSEGLSAAEGTDAPATEDGALRLRLRREQLVRGRLRRGGDPITKVRVSLAGYRVVKNSDQKAGYHVASTSTTRTDAEGRFALAAVGDNVQQFHVDFSGAGSPAVWGDNVPRAAAPSQPLFAVTAGETDFDFDLARCSRVDLQALTEDGGPASNAVVVALPLREDPGFLDDNDPRYRLDPAGRASLLLQRDVEWWVMVLAGTRFHYAVISPAATTRVELHLQQLPRLRLRVVDKNGGPVEGAHLSCRSYGYENAPTAAGNQLRMVAISLYLRWLPRAVSDAKGAIELPVFEHDWAEMAIQATKGSARSMPWQMRWQEDPLEVELPIH